MVETATERETTQFTRSPSRRRKIAAFAAISALLVVPCLWHRRIEAGDLASHVYNVWLAQLIEKGQAPGLYLAKQWNNVLFDLLLLHVANAAGFSAAQKIVVSICVLIFFWGVFTFLAAVTERPPWFLTPCIAMLAYGYSFNMGFVNYYLSTGLACFSLAFFWRARPKEWIAGALLIPIAWLAHPIGFLWLIGTLAYLKIRAKLPGWWEFALPLAAASSFLAVYLYVHHRAIALQADWDRGAFYLYNGADQLALYGERYFVLAGAAFLFGLVCVAVDFYLGGEKSSFSKFFQKKQIPRFARDDNKRNLSASSDERRREGSSWKPFELPFELYLVTFCATSLIPENLRPSMYAGWIGLLGSRLTTISAIFGLCFLGRLKPRKWHLAGFSACAMVFFGFLYQDTAWLNRLESNAEKLVSDLQPGTRVLGMIWAPPGSRAAFIDHVLDRGCVGHCFSYGNYEPASGEFRVRAGKGSPVVTASSDDAEDISSGEYEVDDQDLPIKQIYQCDASDLTKLCIRDLESGEVNGRIGYKPPGR